MRTTRARALAIALVGGLMATTQCFALCLGPGQSLGDGNPYAPRAQTPVPIVPAPAQDRSPVAVPSYSTSNSTIGPASIAVGNGSMSAGIGAGGAMVATSARAGTDRSSYCHRSGRSQTMIDACLKIAAGR